jgi:hypothetical protein
VSANRIHILILLENFRFVAAKELPAASFQQQLYRRGCVGNVAREYARHKSGLWPPRKNHTRWVYNKKRQTLRLAFFIFKSVSIA